MKFSYGMKGTLGQKGNRGLKGEIGIRGDIGPEGVQGEKGISGEKGREGLKGDIGSEGDIGLMNSNKGIVGEKGEKGNVVKLESDNLQHKLYFNSNENVTILKKILKGNIGKKGEPGEKGDRGISGLNVSNLEIFGSNNDIYAKFVIENGLNILVKHDNKLKLDFNIENLGFKLIDKYVCFKVTENNIYKLDTQKFIDTTLNKNSLSLEKINSENIGKIGYKFYIDSLKHKPLLNISLGITNLKYDFLVENGNIYESKNYNSSKFYGYCKKDNLVYKVNIKLNFRYSIYKTRTIEEDLLIFTSKWLNIENNSPMILDIKGSSFYYVIFEYNFSQDLEKFNTTFIPVYNMDVCLKY